MHNRMSLVTLILALFLVVAIPPALAQVTVESQEAKVVRTPSGFLKTEDDSVCTLRWNNYPSSSDSAATRYELQWGVQGQNYTDSAATNYNIYQIQPLVNGTVYNVSVRAIDRWGRASAWSAPYSFTGDGTRVAAIRKQCQIPGGFFDDFNVPTGKLDALLWNFAVSHFCDPNKSGAFINGQNHAHVMVASGTTDRSQNVLRPRATLLDLSDNGTRTIFVDMDSASDNRMTWYLDLIPQGAKNVDITNRATTFATDTSPGPNKDVLRIVNSTTILAIQMTGPDGGLLPPAQVDLAYVNGLDFKTINNVRRPFKFTVSKTLVEAYVADWSGNYIKVLSKSVNIPWNRATVQSDNFAYNSAKDGMTAWLWHFDNFAFDAPQNAAPSPLVYDYRTQKTSGQEYQNGHILNYMVRIPDSVTSWNQRLYFTISKDGANSSQLKSNIGSSVAVNGKSFPLGVPDDEMQSSYIDLPAGTIIPGDNTITFTFTPNANIWYQGISGALNVHIEAIRPSGNASAPAFTTHCAIWGCPPMPTFALGPDITMTDIGGNQVWLYFTTYPPTPILVGGQINVTGQLGQIDAMFSTGHPADVDHIDFMIDKVTVCSVPVKADSLNAGGRLKWTLDTTKLTDGVHELFLRAYTPTGIWSNPNYFNKFGSNNPANPNSYIPVLIRVDNVNPPPSNPPPGNPPPDNPPPGKRP